MQQRYALEAVRLSPLIVSHVEVPATIGPFAFQYPFIHRLAPVRPRLEVGQARINSSWVHNVAKPSSFVKPKHIFLAASQLVAVLLELSMQYVPRFPASPILVKLAGQLIIPTDCQLRLPAPSVASNCFLVLPSEVGRDQTILLESESGDLNPM